MAPFSSKIRRDRFRRVVPRDSLLFLALLALIALAGFNSGNNLLYLIVGTMLGTVFISLVAGRINLSRIKVTRRFPAHTFADSPFKIDIEISNEKRFWKSFGITVENGTNRNEPLFALSIENKGKKSYEKDITLHRRGLHRFSPIEIRSVFPLGLFNMRRKAADTNEIIAYPQIYDLTRLPEGSGQLREEFPQYLKGPGSGFYGVREYRHGEEAAYISWKLSAKLDRLIVRETEREGMQRVCIVLDDALKDESAGFLEAFERAVSNAASLIWYLCESGYSVKLVTHNQVVSYGEGVDHMHRMLTVLALVEPARGSDIFSRVKNHVFEGGRGVLITCGENAPPFPATTGDFAFIMNEKIGAVYR